MTLPPQALHPHPGVPAARELQLSATAERNGNLLILHYGLAGPLDQLRIPQAGPVEYRDGLWQHCCFEAFVQKPGDDGYTEFNFSPCGAWALYRFCGYRQPLPLSAVEAPSIHASRSGNELRLDVCVELPDESRIRLGLSAVLEDQAGQLSYWALAHPVDKPDFHHPDSFILELDGG